MSKMNKTTETISLPQEISESEEVEVTIYYHIANDGIGSYEFWGAKCFDLGHDYPEIDDIQPIFTEDDDEDARKRIKDYIDTNFDTLAIEISDKMMKEGENNE